ncbi:MAG: transglycosylase domain-containing protein [Selenomonadaceae bacterium]|nr:transglycosylase domain-containing protein [Selenomonadaceae bacterium]
MEEKQPPRRKGKRSFKYIIRFFKIVFGLIFVFIASFFVTLAIRASGNSEVPAIEEKYSAKISKEKVPFAQYSEVSLTEKIDRLTNIEFAVAEKRKTMRHYVLFRDIPSNLRQAIIAVEDVRFYAHGGFDIESIARATVVNVEAGEIEEGGSTITQQLAKNLFLTQERSFTRKFEELLLAIEIENHFDKNKILELYLNTIYFGSNFYGVYEAAHGYFGKEPKELTTAECAMLAGIPNAPSIYSPYVNFQLAKKRQLVVINAMVHAHFLSSYEAEKARNEEITLREGFY